jgi:hypothetical protein
MERSQVNKAINDVQDELTRLKNALYALSTTDIQRFPDNYETLSADAALRAERVACRMRHLLYAAPLVRKREYLRRAADAQGIQIEYNDGILEITFPCLFPKRKQWQNAEFLTDALYAAFERAQEAGGLPKFRRCTVCFSHVYSQTLPARRVRDYDNLELKAALDVVGAFALTDDSGLLCDVYHMTERGENSCTKIFVMAPDAFSVWLEKRKNACEKG